MVVIALVGLARSGKDSAADYIIRRYSFAKYTFSDVLKKMLEEKGIPPTKSRMIELGDMLRQEIGMDAIAKMLDKTITKKDNILLVGPRSIEEIDYFKKKYSDLKVIKIVTGKVERFARKSAEDPRNMDEFFKRDETDLKNKGFQKVLDAAELQINNFSTFDDFRNEIDAAMKMVLSE